MAISREKKHEIVAEYRKKLGGSQAVILAEYRGLTVADTRELRMKLRSVGGAFQVVKNTLFKRALTEAGVPVPEEQLRGPVAVGYCFGDVPAVVNALLDAAKTFEGLQVKGAIYGTSLLDAENAKALATLPPREVILAQLLGAIQGPLSSLAGIVAAPLRDLAYVLQARAEKGQGEAAA